MDNNPLKTLDNNNNNNNTVAYRADTDGKRLMIYGRTSKIQRSIGEHLTEDRREDRWMI